MRVCPILEWRLADVWAFMSTYNLPYCALYDRGYASLGSQATTSICPALVPPPPSSPSNTHVSLSSFITSLSHRHMLLRIIPHSAHQVRPDGSFVPAFLLADAAYGDLNDRVGRFCDPQPPASPLALPRCDK
jgi:hypothetical protein